MNEVTIGDYRRLGRIGGGGMSEVFEVESIRRGSHYALKIFNNSKSDGEARERFEIEARILAKLSHPNIVRVVDFGVEEISNRPYFVMDLIRDEKGRMRTLAEIEPGTVDEETIGKWYDDLRTALMFIHSRGIIHRDLKLENVLIGPDGHVVLADFGVSRIFAPEGGGKIVDAIQTIVKVKDGQRLVMGSIGYMAPELELGVEASERSDYFALGVMVYRLLTGSWFDSKIDTLKGLDSYDLVWSEILPKLLHKNPAARECLPYAALVKEARERAWFDSEEALDRERSRGFRMRMVTTIVGGVAAALGAVLLMKVMTGSQLPPLETVLPTEAMLPKDEIDDVIYARNELLGEIYDIYATGNLESLNAYLKELEKADETDEERLRLVRRIKESLLR